MSLLLAWVAFPAILWLLSTGCGLLLERLIGRDLPGPLVPAVGLAAIVVGTGFLTMSDAMAELATPATLAVAVAGFGLSPPGTWFRLGRWEALAALAVFAAFAAPVVLSGEATFAGYIKLDDTATWMAFTDRIMEHGTSTAGLAPSTYEATLAVNLGSGYPIGAFLPLGVGKQLLAEDVAWLVQPYMALLAAMLALVLSEIARPLIRAQTVRAVAVLIAAQPALLFGYSLWGGIKEVAAALLVPLFALAALRAASSGAGPRELVVAAVSGAALVGVLGAGGAVWLIAVLAPLALFVIREQGLRLGLAWGCTLGGALVALSVPVLFAGKTLFSPTQSALRSDTVLGNLIKPLNGLQALGVWPVGDFRLAPQDMAITHLLVAVVVAAALVGLAAAFRARAWALPVYVLGAGAGCLAVVIFASPWVDAKALASSSPAFLLAAMAGAGWLLAGEARPLGAAAAVLIACGVLWSNALAYRNVNLAPRDQLAELERIGERHAGQGPTLITDAEVYGARHFLRRMDAEDPVDLRRRTIPLAGGGLPDEVPAVNTDQLQLGGLLTYRTLVLHRSPSQSRPPSPYQLIENGRYYDVWQRPPGSEELVIAHLGLGSGVEPTGVPDCSEVMRLARRARQSGGGGRLAAIAKPPLVYVGVDGTGHPSAWEDPSDPASLFPRGSGDLTAAVSVPSAGLYTVWLGGSVRGSLDARIDDAPLETVSGQLASTGEYQALGAVQLSRGAHRFLAHYSVSALSPGSVTPAALPYPLGPLILSSGREDPPVRYFRPAQARELCGRSWDWLEAVRRSV